MGRATGEAKLEEFFRKRVRLVGGYTTKLAPMEAGIPDRLAIFPGGRIFLVELKTNTGQLSPIQKIWHERMLAAWNVRVWTLYGEDDIRRWIRAVVSNGDPVPRKPGPQAKPSSVSAFS